MVADSAQDSKYMDLAVAAIDIYLRDMPEIMMTEELPRHHPTTRSTGRGMPDASEIRYVRHTAAGPEPTWIGLNGQPTGAQ